MKKNSILKAVIGLLLMSFCAANVDAQDTLSGQTDFKNVPDSFNLLYHRQKKSLTIESLGEVYTPQLQKTITPNFTSMMTGRFAGLYTSQLSGNPGYDDATLYLRGKVPMVLIDGTPQSFSSINPEQIESITVLKDALSAAMLGLRSANGVVLITTKKGNRNKTQFTFNAQYGMQKPIGLPKFLNAYDYATLYNEARQNDGYPAAYSAADLNAYKNGTDTFGHSNVDWQDAVLRNSSPYSRYDMAVSGGGAGFRYFVNLDYLGQDGIFKNDESRVYNSNSFYKRYILRSNIDIDVTKALSASVNLLGRVQDFNQPGATAEAIFTAIRSTPNSAYPILNRNGSLGGNLNFQNNIYGQVFQSGYRPSNAKDFKIDGSLKLNMDKIAKGLWAKALVALRAFNLEDINRSRTFAVYQDMSSSTATSYKQFNTIGDQANTAAINTQNRLYYSEVSLGYNLKKGKSRVDALVLANYDYRLNNSDLAIRYPGISGNLAYTFDNKYIFQLTAAYNGSNHFAPGNRFGFFPAAGFGWVASNEAFLKNKRWLNLLKFRASYGLNGYDAAGYYDYLQYYTTTAGYNFGNTPTAVTGLSRDGIANLCETWEKAKKLNLGLDAAFVNNHLTLSFDYFNNNYYDLLQQRGTATSILGVTYPNENIGRNRYSGYELQAGWQSGVKDFHYSISANASTLSTKVLYQDEPAVAYAYMQRTGQQVEQLYGYVANGLFQSQAEADASPKPFPGAQAGDIKYKDLNGDGLINGLDQTVISNTKPQVIYGVNLSVSWKGFDASALLQGVANRNLLVTGDNFQAFGSTGTGQAYEYNLNRWSPATAATATYPRVSTGTNINNNLVSSFWVQSGNYMRVKSLELGYSLPGSIIRRLKTEQVRLYVNGYNLFTISSFKLADPESINAVYPLQKIITAGLNLTF